VTDSVIAFSFSFVYIQENKKIAGNKYFEREYYLISVVYYYIIGLRGIIELIVIKRKGSNHA